jgi:DNA-binding CsgD family transcriptional regulator/tetratricopeptide (TPR) repeat protein
MVEGLSKAPGEAASVVSGVGSGVLVERADGLSVLEESLASVRASGEGRLVLVAGEAGVGKTALLRWFCESRSGSVRVLWGVCEPLLTPRPLGPLCDVAEATGGEFEELVMGGARPHEVASALIGELRTRAPTVLVLEDLHWADEATLDVLRLLARRVVSVSALVLASFRDDELDRARQLRIVLGELGGRPVRLKVAPLSPAAVTELAGPHGIEGRELCRRTGGNPFFVTEVLEAGGDGIPETVRDAVLARAGRLSDPARRLLQAVAVVPGRVELWLLEALAGQFAEWLEECLASGMLMAVDGGVAFRHELARLAVEESVAPNRGLAVHRAALARLVDPPAGEPDLARLAHHAEAIGDAETVLRWAPRAAALAASAGAHREAAAHYARTLRFADSLTAEVCAELLELRSYECFLTNGFDDAIDALEGAAALRRELGDLRRLGGVLCSLARSLREAGRTPEAELVVREAIGLLEPLGLTRELGRAYGARCQLCMIVADLEGTVAWGAKAIDIAERLGDTETLVHALASVGTAMLHVGLPDGEEKLERSLRLAQQAGLDGDAGRAFNNLVAAALVSRAYDLAERYVEEGIEYCEDRGLDLWVQLLLANRVKLELDRGRWDNAVDSAHGLLRDPGCGLGPRLEAMVAIALVRARRGDPGVWELLDEALALSEPTREDYTIGQVIAARAEAAWLQARSADAAQATDGALELALKRDDPWAVGELACWRWRAGVRDELPAGAAAEPYALTIAGEWGGAMRVWQEIGCPYEAALALGDADDNEALRQALARLQGLGASAAAAIVARRLRARGARGLPRGPRPRTRENPAGLTGRELEVLALLADGLRNAQIAERLVVSEKTVDHHVSAILRKLDVRTRGEAGAAGVRLGLTDPR